MDVSKHILASCVLAWVLYPAIGLDSLWIVFGGVLIDFDHYLYTLFRFKRWSVRFSYYYHRYHRREFKQYEPDILHIFHTWEAFLVVLLLSLVSLPFFYMFQGMILHILMDFIILFKHNIVEARAISFFGWIRRHYF